MSSKSASAAGVAIGKKWKAGKKIGSGACAVVYDLVTTDGRSTDYVVKMTPVPKKKTKKNGKTKEEIDASLLHYEQLVYQTQFQRLQGKTIPSIPFAGPPITGESGGKLQTNFWMMVWRASVCFEMRLQIEESVSSHSF